MIRFAALILIVGITAFSCQKENPKKYDRIRVPHADSLDINHDGRPDFYTDYDQWVTEDINQSSGQVSGELRAIGENRILTHETNGSLFLKLGDTLFKSTSTPYAWKPRSADLIERNWNGKRWDKNWHIQSASAGFHAIGFYLENDGNDQIGWIQLHLDKTTGHIRVVTTYQTSTDFLVLQ